MGLMSDSLVLVSGTECRGRKPPPLSGGARGGRGSGLYLPQPRSTELIAGLLQRGEKFSGTQKAKQQLVRGISTQPTRRE